MTTEPNEEELRALAARRVKSRRELLLHVSAYAIVNVAIVAIWAVTGPDYPWFVWPMLGWGIGVAFHVLSFALGLDADTGRNQRAIERELERLRRSQQTS